MVPLARHLNIVRETEATYMIRVAFSSDDGKTVNQHFGYARSFMVYGVSSERIDLLSVAEFDEQSPEEDKLASRIELLSGCAAVYSYACGAAAVRRLIAWGIQPIRVTEEAPIKELLEALQREIKQGPGSWLAKAILREQRLSSNPFGHIDTTNDLES